MPLQPVLMSAEIERDITYVSVFFFREMTVEKEIGERMGKITKKERNVAIVLLRIRSVVYISFAKRERSNSEIGFALFSPNST